MRHSAGVNIKISSLQSVSPNYVEPTFASRITLSVDFKLAHLSQLATATLSRGEFSLFVWKYAFSMHSVERNHTLHKLRCLNTVLSINLVADD